MLTFHKSIASHIEHGGFSESLLWLVAAWVVFFLTAMLIILLLRYLLLTKTQTGSDAGDGVIGTQQPFKFGKSTFAIFGISIVLLVAALCIWHSESDKTNKLLHDDLDKSLTNNALLRADLSNVQQTASALRSSLSNSDFQVSNLQATLNAKHQQPHFHLVLVTFDNKTARNVWLHLTNDFLELKDVSGQPFKSGMAGILAIPVRPDKTNDYLQFSVWNDSSVAGNITDVRWQWSGNYSMLAGSAQGGWIGTVPEAERGFSDSLFCQAIVPMNVRPARPSGIPLLQFTNFLDPSKPIQSVKGIAEIRISGTDFDDITYAFCIQNVKDTNWTAYVVEEPIRREGDEVEFLEPVRPQ